MTCIKVVQCEECGEVYADNKEIPDCCTGDKIDFEGCYQCSECKTLFIESFDKCPECEGDSMTTEELRNKWIEIFDKGIERESSINIREQELPELLSVLKEKPEQPFTKDELNFIAYKFRSPGPQAIGGRIREKAKKLRDSL